MHLTFHPKVRPSEKRSENDSPRNTGSQFLPPAQPALVWYPYVSSERFPAMGQGGRNVLVGGMYRYNSDANSGGKWPDYYDGKLVVSDFIRRKLLMVSIDEAGRTEKIETVAEDAGLTSPLDMEFGPDGAIYVMNYGSIWHAASDDSNITKIEFLGYGNRNPVIELELGQRAGSAPFTFTASDSFWVEGKVLTQETGRLESMIAAGDACRPHTYFDGDYVALERTPGRGNPFEALPRDYLVLVPGESTSIWMKVSVS